MILRKGDLDTNISFRVPASVMEQVLQAADAMDASLSQTVRRLVILGLSAKDQQRAA